MAYSFTNNPLTYPQNSNSPIRRVKQNRAPTTGDNQNFIPGDEWLDTSSRDWWKLVDVRQGSALWVKIGNNTGQAETLTGNTGGAVSPDANANINVVGDGTYITIAGTPVNNTLTASLVNGTTFANSFPCDTGTATPSGGVLNVVGGNGATTTGSGNTITIDYWSLTPYIVGTDANSQYSTIQAAITQAVADGASASTPKNIFIKAGSYNESPTVSDGINLIGFGYTYNSQNPCTRILGNVSASGTCKFIGIGFFPASGNAINFTSGAVCCEDCFFSISGTDIAINMTTASSKNVIINQCNFSGTTASAFASDGSDSSIGVVLQDTNISMPTGTSTFAGPAGTLAFNANSCSIAQQFVVDCPNITSQHFNCAYSTDNVGIIWTFGSSTTGAVRFNQTFFNNGAPVSIGNANLSWGLPYCFTSNYTGSSIVANNDSNNEVNLVLDYIMGAQIFDSGKIGYTNTSLYSSQDVVQTSSTSPTTLISLAVPTDHSIILRGLVNGSNAGHTDMTGGDFTIFANNSGGTVTVIGTPAINVMASTTGTFADAASGANLLLQVTAPSADPYNWSTSYSYQFLGTDA